MNAKTRIKERVFFGLQPLNPPKHHCNHPQTETHYNLKSPTTKKPLLFN
ncbi:hypothetical protein EMIT0324P_270003 [Pseudomonas chlororaphis]